MLNLLPNELVLELLFFLDLPTLHALLRTHKRVLTVYQGQLEYFWTWRYVCDFRLIVPDQLALTYEDKYKLYRLIIDPAHKWTLINTWGTDCRSLAVFNAADANEVHQIILNSGNAILDDPGILKGLLPRLNNYTFMNECYELIHVPIYKAIDTTNTEITSFGYLDGASDYYDIIANFSGFSEEQIFVLLAFLHNLGSGKEGDIAHFIADMLAAYDRKITIATASDVEQAYAAARLRASGVKYVFNSVLCY